jgi:hypothetical protein
MLAEPQTMIDICTLMGFFVIIKILNFDAKTGATCLILKMLAWFPLIFAISSVL